jgi:hypothetical protein
MRSMVKHIIIGEDRFTDFFSREGTYSRFLDHISAGECERLLKVWRAMAGQVYYVTGR